MNIVENEGIAIPHDVILSSYRAQVDELNYQIVLRNIRINQLEEEVAQLRNETETHDAAAEG